jgi:hypothetical protein
VLTFSLGCEIVIADEPVGVVVIAFDRSSLETVNWKPDSLPLISERE